MKHLTPTVRRWVYSLAVASLPVLVHYNLVEPEASPLWLAFVLAFVNVTDE